MKIRSKLVHAALLIFLTSCANEGFTEEEIVDAIDESKKIANNEGLMGSDYRVYSAVILYNGDIDFKDTSGSEERIRGLVDKLKGSAYWKICFATTHELMVAPTYCYFVEKGSNKLLATYHMK